MTWTALRIVEQGVVLRDGHAARMALAGEEILQQFRAFTASASPGAYTLTARAGHLEIERVAASRLVDGMPTRALDGPAPHPGAGDNTGKDK